ncbi:MAG: S46 family peptidase [Bacteroidia bacterium]|nr:S46 family peptidase [Bacteroidia bacterium]
MRKIFGVVVVIWSITTICFADEGMWLLSAIYQNFDDLKAKGIQLTPEDIYSVNKSCLKDAIGGIAGARSPFSFFCTGELISGEGLMLTNHHCGYDVLQQHSSVEQDFLKNGFWAKTHEEELQNEDLCVSFLVYMEDVTDKVLAEVNENMTEPERSSKISDAIHKIKKEVRKSTEYIPAVEGMFEENKYYLFVYETFYDVRIVGAPPESIGKFGGDTDNWMWPRHTGDFCLFRVYMSPDGKGVPYSANNVPYKPKHFLPVSLNGVQKGDFAMVLGFPGSTERYLTSFGVKEALEITNPATIKIRTKKLEMMKQGMDINKKIRLQYASKYAQTANYWKYYIGQNRGLKRLKVIEKKQEIEAQFMKWVNQESARKEKYSEALTLIENYYTGNKEKALANKYLEEALLQGGEILIFPSRIKPLVQLLQNASDNKDLINEMTVEIKESAKEFYKDYNSAVDKNITKELLKLYLQEVPEEYQLEIFKEILKKYKGDINKFTDELFKESIFSTEENFYAFLDKPSYKVIANDWAYKLMTAIVQEFVFIRLQRYSPEFSKGMRLFVQGLMEMQKDKKFYPDANSTIRLTYGTVGDYKPADAVYYSYYTTLEGIIEKEDTSNYEFIVPERLKELYNSKDYGRYADKDGSLHICFITNNDITGGNSGSPVINSKGELIGAAFDGNWEAMSGDITYETELQKCICCDIRYVLFVIEKIGNAKNLIDEMKIVN